MWVNMTYGTTNINYVTSLAVSGSDVYAAADFGDSNTVVAYVKDGGSLNIMHNPYNGSYDYYVNAIAVSSSVVYLGGSCDNRTGGGGEDVAGYWAGNTWHPLPNTYGATYRAYVNVLAISGSDVYSGGCCFDSLGNQIAGYWKNTTWVSLPNARTDITTSSTAVSLVVVQ